MARLIYTYHEKKALVTVIIWITRVAALVGSLASIPLSLGLAIVPILFYWLLMEIGCALCKAVFDVADAMNAERDPRYAAELAARRAESYGDG